MQPLPDSWVALFGVIVPIFCRLGLPNQAHWFVDMVMDGVHWCFGRGWDLFVLHVGFNLGDQILFAYQGDGLFIVSRLDVGPPLPIFNDPIIHLPDVDVFDPMVNMQQIFDEWDNAAAQMMDINGFPAVALIQDEWDDAAAHMAAVVGIPAATLIQDEGHAPAIDADDQHQHEVEESAPAVDEPLHVEPNMPPLEGGIHVGESSDVAPDLDLNLGEAGTRKRATYPKTVGPVFTKKIEQTHLTNALSIPKSFWETYIRKPPGTYEFKFQMGRFTWDVVIKFKHSRVRVTRGFTDFLQGNDLVVGNMLKFELVRGRKSLFYVTRHF